jgi:hypothetical protein
MMIFIQIAAELPTEAAPTAVLLSSEPLPVADPMHPLSLVDLSRDQTTFHGHTTSSELLTLPPCFSIGIGNTIADRGRCTSAFITQITAQRKVTSCSGDASLDQLKE